MVVLDRSHNDYLDRGACLIDAPDVSGVGHRVFCSTIARRHCNYDDFVWSASALASIRSGIASLGIAHVGCTVDADAQVVFLDGLSAPTQPLLAKRGVTIGALTATNISMVAVESCEDIGLSSTEYAAGAGGLLAESDLALFRDPRLLLWRFSDRIACRNCIPLTAGERTMLQSVASGAVSDFALCKSGVADSSVLDCPVRVSATLGW